MFESNDFVHVFQHSNPVYVYQNISYRKHDVMSFIGIAASLMAIATPVGALVCGPCMDLMGRKLFSLITTLPIACSWFLLVLTPNYTWSLYFARILAGFGGGKFQL